MSAIASHVYSNTRDDVLRFMIVEAYLQLSGEDRNRVPLARDAMHGTIDFLEGT